jgi:hypothetical protein
VSLSNFASSATTKARSLSDAKKKRVSSTWRLAEADREPRKPGALLKIFPLSDVVHDGFHSELSPLRQISPAQHHDDRSITDTFQTTD